MNQRTSRTTTWVFAGALVLALVASLTPGGRALLTRVSTAIGASATSDGRYEVAVTLNYDNGGSFEWRAPISRQEFTEAEMTKRHVVNKYFGEARKALARKMGYFEDLYGDSDKLTAVQLAKMTVSDLRSGSDTTLIGIH